MVQFKAGDIVRIRKTGEIGTVRDWQFTTRPFSVYCPVSGVTEYFRADELEAVHNAIIVTREQYENLATGQPDPLSQPEPPAWLRVGWWYSMDEDGTWWATEQKPTVDFHCGEWTAGGNVLLIEDEDWLSWHGKSVPVARWQEACWQVTE